MGKEKSMQRYFPISLFLLLSCAAVSCYDCGPKAEPTAEFNMSFDSLYGLKKISAVGAKSDSAFNQNSPYSSRYHYGQYPISLLQDSTTFIFYAANRTDTLTLFYERVFDTDSKCGYYVDIEGRSFKSTFKSVWVEFGSYRGDVVIGKQHGGAGIRVNISNQ
jgi:hypothetical protein